MIWEFVTTALSISVPGALLIILHYYKANKTLMIHQKSEIFDRKQKMYRYFLRHFFETVSLSKNPLREKGNWRIGNYFYNELLCLASKEVMDAYHNYLLMQDKPAINDIQFTDAKKELLSAIRKDLTNETIIDDTMLFFAASDGISFAYKFMNEHYSVLKPHNLTNLENFAQIDVNTIASKTKLDHGQLQRIKDIASNEVQIDLEYRKLMQQLAICNNI